MHRILYTFLFLAFVNLCPGQSVFKESQLSYARVSEAYLSKWEGVDLKLKAGGLDPGNYISAQWPTQHPIDVVFLLTNVLCKRP